MSYYLISLVFFMVGLACILLGGMLEARSLCNQIDKILREEGIIDEDGNLILEEEKNDDA